MTKGVKISLFLVLFATIGINVFFIVETTKKLNLQTTADYPTSNENGENQFPVRNGDQQQQGKTFQGEYNHFYNNDLIPPTVNSGFESSGLRGESGNDHPKISNIKVDSHQFTFDGIEVDNDQQNINAPQRSNQLKLQEFSKPKSISIEVLSSKSRVSVIVDGTTVSKYTNCTITLNANYCSAELSY